MFWSIAILLQDVDMLLYTYLTQNTEEVMLHILKQCGITSGIQQ